MTKQHEVYLLVGGHSDGRGGGSSGGRGSSGRLDGSASKVLALQTQDLSPIPRMHVKRGLRDLHVEYDLHSGIPSLSKETIFCEIIPPSPPCPPSLPSSLPVFLYE